MHCVNMGGKQSLTQVTLKAQSSAMQGIYTVMAGFQVLSQNMSCFQGGKTLVLTMQVAETDPKDLQSQLSAVSGVLSCKCT